MSRLSMKILIPAYNEELGIGPTISRALEALHQLDIPSDVMVVNDGSVDGTLRVAESMGVNVISMKRNVGKGAALKVAFHLTKDPIIATVDADGSYPVERIPDMLHLLLTNGADMIVGSRFLGEIRGGMSLTNKIGNIFFSWLISVLTGVKVTDASSGLRVFRRELVEKLDIRARGLDFEVELTTLAAKSGYKIVELPITYVERIGRSKLKSFRDGAKFLKSIFTARFLRLKPI